MKALLKVDPLPKDDGGDGTGTTSTPDADCRVPVTRAEATVAPPTATTAPPTDVAAGRADDHTAEQAAAAERAAPPAQQLDAAARRPRRRGAPPPSPTLRTGDRCGTRRRRAGRGRRGDRHDDTPEPEQVYKARRPRARHVPRAPAQNRHGTPPPW